MPLYGVPTPLGILQSAGINCHQWLNLPILEKHRLARNYYSLLNLTLSSMARAQVVNIVDRYCATRRMSPAGDTISDGLTGGTDPTASTGSSSNTNNQDSSSSSTGNNTSTGSSSGGSQGSGSSIDFNKLFNTLVTAGAPAAAQIAGNLSQTDRVRLNDDTQLKLAQLRYQYGASTDPLQQQAVGNQISQLLQLQSLISPKVNPTQIMFLLLAGAAVIGGIVFLSKQNK